MIYKQFESIYVIKKNDDPLEMDSFHQNDIEDIRLQTSED